MNLPSLPSFRAEAFPGAPEWLARLLALINTALRPLHLALSRLPELAIIEDRTFTTEASGSVFVDLKNPLSSKPRCVQLGKLAAVDATAISAPFTFTWSMTGTQIRVLFTGLGASTKYLFSVTVQ